MNKITLYHNSHRIEYRSPFGSTPCGTKVVFSLDISGLPPDCAVSLRIWFQESGETLIPMQLTKETDLVADASEGGASGFGGSGSGASGAGPSGLGSSGFLRKYSAGYTTPSTPGLVWYYFIVQSFGITRFYGNNAQSRGGVGAEAFSPPPSFQITNYEPGSVPAWWKEGLVYQIFVDRFARGSDWKERFFNAIEDEKDRNGPTRLLQVEWRDAPFLYKDDRGWVMRWPFFGGTLEGVREKLLYLRGLGVTVLYLNPIFEAASNHKYDTGDYMKIDPGYGDELIFSELTREASELGISVVLDGVFNHTGADSLYFNKYGNYDSEGAWQSQNSPYRKWYRFNHSTDGYESWWGVSDLPNVEEHDPDFQRLIYGGEDSVIKHWLKAGARGWRLDVADELPDDFIKNIRTALKETTPDGLLLGEVWEDASNKRSYGVMREYLLGSELDATMNYPFRNWCIDFALNIIIPAEVHSRVMSIYENYPREYFYSCMNLLSSHDRIRILSVLGEAPDEGSLSEWQKQSWRLNYEQKELARRRLKLLSLWQMTFPGVPSIFYGDEAGVEGFSDPYNRAPFPWNREDEDLLNWYRIIGNLRTEYEVLRNGGFTSYGGYQFIYAFSRDNDNERILVFLNPSRSNPENVTISVYNGENVFLELLSGSILEADKNEGSSTIRLTIGPLECRAVYIKKAAPESLIMKNQLRSAGVLCHITSLPSDTGCGDMGTEAYDFIDYLASAGQRIWQILPLNPTGAGNSPYSGCSAFAGNELLLDCRAFLKQGLLTESDLPKKNLTARVLNNIIPGGKSRSDFERAAEIKYPLYEKAFDAFDLLDSGYRDFYGKNEYWLRDYCRYRALHEHFKYKPWQEWPAGIRDRDAESLERYDKLLSRSMDFHGFLQYQFEKQWNDLKAHAKSKDVSILGDMPIFVAADSCDTWVNREIFLLDEEGYPLKTGGCPPDAFTDDGQNWKMPIFNWKVNSELNWSWWIKRFGRNLKLFDFMRLDHFRGFDACWEIPGGEETARNGCWLKGPGKELFEAAMSELGPLPFLAEDLGVITSNVNDLRNTFLWPGMKVYQFHSDMMQLVSREAFLAPAERPSEETKKSSIGDFLQVYYTGTHDNDTLAGWVKETMFSDVAESDIKAADSVVAYGAVADREGAFGTIGAASAGATDSAGAGLGSSGADSKGITAGIVAKCKEIIEGLYASDAMWVILPLQDVWFLDSSARMNLPGTVENNWVWAASKGSFTEESAQFLKEITNFYRR